ncbi:ORF6N domain protein [compost metagenome]
MFQLSKEEYDHLRSQFVTLKTRGTHSKYLPHVFTEQGIAMLSSVLNSKQAIQINIQIIRIFSKLKQFLSNHTEVRLEISEIKLLLHKLASKQEGQDKNIELLFHYMDRLQEETESTAPKDHERIGFRLNKDNRSV